MKGYEWLIIGIVFLTIAIIGEMINYPFNLVGVSIGWMIWGIVQIIIEHTQKQ